MSSFLLPKLNTLSIPEKSKTVLNTSELTATLAPKDNIYFDVLI